MAVKLRPPEKPLTLDRVLTTGEVAQVLGCAPRTAAVLIDTGAIVGYRLLNDRRCERSALEAYMRANNMPIKRLETFEQMRVNK